MDERTEFFPRHNVKHDLLIKSNDTESEPLSREVLSNNKRRSIIINSIYRPANTDIRKYNNSMFCTLGLINRENKTCYILRGKRYKPFEL